MIMAKKVAIMRALEDSGLDHLAYETERFVNVVLACQAEPSRREKSIQRFIRERLGNSTLSDKDKRILAEEWWSRSQDEATLVRYKYETAEKWKQDWVSACDTAWAAYQETQDSLERWRIVTGLCPMAFAGSARKGLRAEDRLTDSFRALTAAFKRDEGGLAYGNPR